MWDTSTRNGPILTTVHHLSDDDDDDDDDDSLRLLIELYIITGNRFTF